MNKCKPTDTSIAIGTKLSKQDEGIEIDYTLYKRLVGSLMYLTTTRPDIMYAISLISRFMENPKISHWKVGKRILRYIAGTIDYGIWYSTSEDDSLVGYADSVDDRKSTYGYAFMFGTCLISWASKKQPIITISSTEAEYVAGTSVACHAVWLRRILSDLAHEENEPTPIFCDNSSTIALSKNHVFHRKSKHIDTR
jgi:hypothetical protein